MCPRRTCRRSHKCKLHKQLFIIVVFQNLSKNKSSALMTMHVFLTDCPRSTHLALTVALLSHYLVNKELKSKFRVTKRPVLEQLSKAKETLD